MARLRITGGRCRGRVLREAIAPGVRPTTDRVREALFSTLGQDLSGLRWLDAFAGTGIVALEAWSRGAEVTAIERNRRALAGLKRRGAELDADWVVLPGDALSLAGGLSGFDIVFADPPYAVDPVPVLQALAPTVVDRLILEVAEGTVLPKTAPGIALRRIKEYGSTKLGFYETLQAAR
ncbi:MAG: RsmD family RNA methyltransferase [Myxococcota bacterium]